ncbi:hypothetical protein EHI2019_000467800 [Entamoeba histolytica]
MCEVKCGYSYGYIITPDSCATFIQYPYFKEGHKKQKNIKKSNVVTQSNLTLTEENLSIINHITRMDKKQRINQWKQNNETKDVYYPHPFIYGYY